MPHRNLLALVLIASCVGVPARAADHSASTTPIPVRPLAASVSEAPAAATGGGPMRLWDDDGSDSLGLAHQPRTRASAFSAIASPVDSFLIYAHAFETPAHACEMRGWTGENRATKLWAHVDAGHVVNDGFVNMGSRGLWFGTDQSLDPGEVENWLQTTGYGNNWSQRLTSPAFSRAAHPAAVLRFDAKVALARGFSGAAPISTIGLLSGRTGQEFLGAQALTTSGTWVHLTGRHRTATGPATWRETPPVFSSFWTSTGAPPPAAFNSPRQVAVDNAGNVYVADYNNNRIAKLGKDGAPILTWGTLGSGPGQFNGPIGVAVDRTTNEVYVSDSRNNRVQKFTSSGAFVLQWGSLGNGPGQFNQTQHLAVDALGHVYVVDQVNARVQKFTSAGVWEADLGNTGPNALVFPYGVAVAANGFVYVTDISFNRIVKLDSGGAWVGQWGSLGAGTGNTNIPTGLALDKDGDLYAADQNNNRVLKYDVSGATGVFLAQIGNTSFGSLNFSSPQGLAITAAGDLYVTENGPSRSRVDHWAVGGPVAGEAVFKYEVRLDQDGNEGLPLADPLRVRIVMQTNSTGSNEDGGLLAGDDAITVVDNLSLTDSGGDVLPPVDFEDGTTGGWALSATNGALSGNNLQPSFIRGDAPDTQVRLQSGFDANDPSCVWTFTTPSGFVAPGTLATLVSPWIPITPTDWPSLVFRVSAKYPVGGNDFIGFKLLGRHNGESHATLLSRPSFLFFGGFGNSDLSSQFGPDAFSTATDFGTPTGPTTVDQVRIVVEVSDQIERRLGNPATRPPTRLPIMDDMQAVLLHVDQDFDGVRDIADGCPTVCAAGRDADGNGCPDPGATLKHLETWAQGRRPIHYALSTQGLPGITDGSDMAALRTAFAAWQGVADVDLPLVEDAPTAQTDAVSGDAVHLLTFADDYEFPANVLAITPTLSYTRRQVFDDVVALPGQIVDADIMFNPRARFRTATQGPATGSFDLQSVATHEIGHFLGLSHSGVPEATMYPVLQDGTGAASLEEDDRTAILSAYPEPTFVTAYGTITGHLTRGGTGVPIPGAFVYAAHVDGGGAVTTAAASDYTDESGAYALHGLTPGNYAVRVLPLDGSRPGLLPGAVNAEVDAIAQTNFAPEWYGGPESLSDDPDVHATLAVGVGSTVSGIDILSNVDVTPPTVDAVSPDAGQADVRIDAPVVVTFSEPVQSSTLAAAFRLHKVGQTTRLGGIGQLLSSGLTFVFAPSAPLEFDTPYQVDVTTALTDREGNALAVDAASTFRTQLQPAVSIADIEPRQAPVGALVTVSGTAYDAAPGAENRVYFSTPSGTDFVLGTFVTPTSMVVRVPANAASGPVRVQVGGSDSNLLAFDVLTSEVSAPSASGAAIPLSFQPSDVVTAPGGDAVFAVGEGRFARVNLSPARPSQRVALETAVANALRVALVPTGLRAWVTRPDFADANHLGSLVSELDTDPASATYGQVLGSLALPGDLPDGIVVSANGQRAYVSDQSSHRVLELDVDPTSSTFRALLREIQIPNALLSGAIALDPRGRTIYAGSDNLGLLAVDLSVDPPVATQLEPTPDGEGIAVTPTGTRLLALEGGAAPSRLVFRDLPPATSSGLVQIGGELRGLATSPGGATAFVVNAQFAQLQVLDVTQATPTLVATVATGARPVAVSLSASGSLVAVANSAGRSLSLFTVATASATPVRIVPSTALPGDPVAVQTSGGALTPSDRLDLGAGEFAFARTTSTAGAFVVPAQEPGDASLTLSSGGTRSLSLPFRIQRPIAATVPRPTGVVLGPLDMTCGALGADGALAVLRVSPDGRLLAVSRAGTDCLRLDLYRLSSSQGAERFGERLLDGVPLPGSLAVRDMAFTPDGGRLWIATDAAGMAEVGVDPAAPGFGSVLAFGAAEAGSVRAIASDPFGRHMIVSAQPAASPGEVQLWSAGRTLETSVAVGGIVHSLVATPDGHHAVAGGEGRVYFVDLDTRTLAATSPAHAVSPPDAVGSVAVSTDGRRAMGVFPNGRIALWNTDPAGPIGEELYFGIPVPGRDIARVLAAPDGHDLLGVCADGTLLELDPAVAPPLVATPQDFGQPVRAIARTQDGRQLWVSNWSDATLVGDVRLFATTAATRLSVLAGQAQSAPAGSALPLPIRVRVTNDAGDAEAGVLVRFALPGASHGSLTPGPVLADELTDMSGEASVAWSMPATPADVAMTIEVPGVPGASASLTAVATGSNATTLPAVVELGPATGATGILSSSTLFVRFNQPMRPDSILTQITLTADGAQVALVPRLEDGGHVAFLKPASSLPYSADCVLTVGPGALDADGQRSLAGASTSFTVQPAPVLHLTSLSPPSGPAGVTLTITGDGFDPIPVRNIVRVNGIVTPVISATPTAIVTTVPAETPFGTSLVTVEAGTTVSPSLEFVVPAPRVNPLALSDNAAARGGIESIAITPDGTRAYITLPASNSVIAFSLLTRRVIKAIPVGLQPQDISILPDGTRAYVANTSSNDLSVIDIDPASPTYHQLIQSPGHPVKVGKQPTSVVVAAYGPQLLVLNSGDGTVSIVDAANGNATYDRVVSTASAGSGGKQIIVTPDGGRAYIANSDGIVMLDLRSRAVTTVAATGSGGKQVAINPDGTILFALTGIGDLLVIDIAPGSSSFNRVVATATTGSGGKQVAISPDGTMLYLTLHDQNAVRVFRIVSTTGGGAGSGTAPGPAASLVDIGTIGVGDGPSGIAMGPTGTFAVVVNSTSGSLSLLGLDTPHGSVVAAQPAAVCITPSRPCVAVPVTIARDSVASLLAFSVKLRLSAELAPCGAGITESDYLSGLGSTFFHVTDQGGGDFTVDGTLLGAGCGATAPAGTLFTLALGSASASGTGTITVTGVTLRDCANREIPSLAAPPVTVSIDNTIPAAPATLSAAQLKSESGGDGTTRVALAWPQVGAGEEALVYRAAYGNYPEYDDAPGAGSVPAAPTYPPGPRWTLVGTFPAATTSVVDEPATRDFWYYAAFARDGCGNVSPASTRTSGTLNYHLGDISDGLSGCTGDNQVGIADLSLLGAHYGAVLGASDPLACIDVGPTTDFSPNTRPTTDNHLGFEDLILMAINFHTVSAPQARPAPAPSPGDAVALDAPATVHAGETVRATVRFSGTGAVQALAVRLGWNADVLEPVGLESGGFAEAQGGVVMDPGGGGVDAALLGARSSGLVGTGALAEIRFRARADGDPALAVRSVVARNAANRPVTVALGGPGATLPAHTLLEAARPNPFVRSTELRFAIARGGPVELMVYEVSGRQVRKLARGEYAPGEYRVVWEGADDAGHPVPPGIYYLRLSAPGVRTVRTLIRMH